MTNLASRFGCGCSSEAAGAVFASPTDALVECGSSLVLLNTTSGQQRLRTVGGQGIQACACAANAGIVAVAGKGFQPSIDVFEADSLQHLQSIHASTAFGYSALALSADGELLAVAGAAPDLLLTVWQWRTGVPLAGAELKAAVSCISFHPADPSCLLTTSTGGGVHTWQLHKLWDRQELQATALPLPNGCKATCHAWAPEGVYVGCEGGSVLCLSQESGALLGSFRQAAGSNSASSAQPPDRCVSPAAASISAIAVNKQWVVVASSASPQLTFLQRCPAVAGGPAQPSGAASLTAGLAMLGSVQVSAIGCRGLAFGGPLHRDLLASTLDGSLLLLTHGSGTQSTVAAPSQLHVEPLADWHVGAIVGLVATPDCTHLISCGVDSSIRVWAASTHGRLVNRRDVGGRLTCCAASSCLQQPLMAIGSQAGVLRLVSLSNPLVSLPVTFQTRLFAGPVSQLAFSGDGTHLAAAAAAAGAGQHDVVVMRVQDGADGDSSGPEVLGCVTIPDSVRAMTWLPGSAALALLLSLAGGRMAVVLPADLAHHSGGGSGGTVQASQQAAVDAELQAMAVLPGSSAGEAIDLIALSSDGQLHWLRLPGDAASWQRFAATRKPLHSISRLILPVPGVAMAVSGQRVLVATQDGSLLMLPAAAGEAEQAVSGDVSIATTPPVIPASCAASARLVFSACGRWVASGAADGSLVLHQTDGRGPDIIPHQVADCVAEPAAAAVHDADAADDDTAPTWFDAAAKAAAAAALAAAAGTCEGMLERVQDLQRRLRGVLAANEAAPPAQRLSEAAFVVDTQLLAELRAQVAAEEAQLLADAARQCQEHEVQAARLQALCWDAYQVKGALCTGLQSSAAQVANFAMLAQADDDWPQVAEQRRQDILAAHQHLLQELGGAAGCAASPAAGAGAGAAADAGQTAADGGAGVGSEAAVSSQQGCEATEPDTCISEDLRATLQRLRDVADARECAAADLFLPELEATSPEAKALQAALCRRCILELKTEFNADFQALVVRKHADADRLFDLGARQDELVRELVKLHLLLHPETSSAAATPCADTGAPNGSRAAASGVPAQPSPAALPTTGDPGALTAAQLSAHRLVPHWSHEEETATLLPSIHPGDIKAAKYLSPAERAEAATTEDAAAAAQRAAEANASRDRALQHMMNGRLERSVDEVAELATSRPAWMSGDPAGFSEEQLRQYKEHQAREAAATEERLKRRGIMETELRTLQTAAQDTVAKFDAAVVALAAKRLTVLAQVTALEGRELRLLADNEVAAVTAGSAAQARASGQLQAAQHALAAIEQELGATHELLQHEQAGLTALHAEEKASDATFKRQFGQLEATPQLTVLFKARLAPPPGQQLPHDHHPEGLQPCTAAGSAALVFGPAAPSAQLGGAGLPCAVLQLTASQQPGGLDDVLWRRFTELHAARAHLELVAREQAGKVACLKRQAHLLQARQAEASEAVRAAQAALASLQARHADALQDVEVQLALTQGQVECWALPAAVAAGEEACPAVVAPDALLVQRREVQALNSVIQGKGRAKLELLRGMMDIKRGIHQVQWECGKADMQAEDAGRLTQQLQLLNITKELQQRVRAATRAADGGGGSGASGSGVGSSSNHAGGRLAAAGGEEAGLAKLLQVRETLHASAVARKRRQLRAVTAQVTSKARENAAFAQVIATAEHVPADVTRIRAAAAASSDSPSRRARVLATQARLRAISDAQMAEIATKQAELQAWRARSFPCLPVKGDGGGAAPVDLKR